MDRLIIEGGHPLNGEVTIAGAKNAALGLIPAVILSEGVCRLENLPNIKDVNRFIDILGRMGAKVERENGNTVIFDTENVEKFEMLDDETKKMRASYYLIGALLGRFKKVVIPFPGGCNIGVRPIDQHIKGFEALGAKVSLEHGIISAEADELIGAPIYLDVVSVGATINIMLAAVKAKGVTVLENAAKEPHVVDVANFLNLMGANIKGAGTDVIKITGVQKMHGCEYMVIPDQIEAGTYMIAAAATKGDVLVKNVIPKHLESISAKLMEMGAEIIEHDDAVRVIGKEPLKAVNIKTLPYPGFPTDLQQPMAVLMCMAEGTGTITESIFENRFKYVDELIKMGAEILVNGRAAMINGRKKLSGTTLSATDLRAGAAMVIAGLVADGKTEVTELKHLDRGYENMERKLLDLGANIIRIRD
ncbi:UDP-N-acetylglucosamine 1-carboxyvinyltransferase [Alkalibacter saccharofermentans]|uniref:UDP-N-acetylglucosamine 1-carboxyvinyltransferase n=1 Tax=Alkalibacter saccharofermentans DSM 14828 TaxID=1120975 RepID=A0A1M4TIE7_9FIRM|nr:UDP-N-acetylglucosamine 1-carboxyvinyltransferase [Alkalibacter saccharofermentans]SHE44047.1 UDP-N-acetylglucosamine 1-carboxyvinyltransferase [Alkalibacter saccharofermentans DSM 14828]